MEKWEIPLTLNCVGADPVLLDDESFETDINDGCVGITCTLVNPIVELTGKNIHQNFTTRHWIKAKYLPVLLPLLSGCGNCGKWAKCGCGALK